MKEFLLGNTGNIEDIRCTMKFMVPTTEKQILEDLDWLYRSLEAERKNYNGQTVVKMIEAKTRKLQKQLKEVSSKK